MANCIEHIFLFIYLSFPVKYLSMCFGHFITGILVDILRVLHFIEQSHGGYVVCNYFPRLQLAFSIFYSIFSWNKQFSFCEGTVKKLFLALDSEYILLCFSPKVF